VAGRLVPLSHEAKKTDEILPGRNFIDGPVTAPRSSARRRRTGVTTAGGASTFGFRGAVDIKLTRVEEVALPTRRGPFMSVAAALHRSI
jgi:hypothetical protein